MEKPANEPVLDSLQKEETFFPESSPLQPPKHARRKVYGFWDRTILSVGTGLYVPVPKPAQHGIKHKDNISISWQRVPVLRRLLLKGLSVQLPGGQIVDLDSKDLRFFVTDRREALFEETEEALIWFRINPEDRQRAIAEGWEEA